MLPTISWYAKSCRIVTDYHLCLPVSEYYLLDGKDSQMNKSCAYAERSWRKEELQATDTMYMVRHKVLSSNVSLQPDNRQQSCLDMYHTFFNQFRTQRVVSRGWSNDPRDLTRLHIIVPSNSSILWVSIVGYPHVVVCVWRIDYFAACSSCDLASLPTPNLPNWVGGVMRGMKHSTIGWDNSSIGLKLLH